MTMDNKKRALNLADFASDTTLHGLNQACEVNSSIFRRVVWISLLLGAIVAYLYLMITSTLKYYSYDTNTKITELPETELEFPSVSICQQNMFAKALVQNYPDLRFWIEYLELHPNAILTSEEKQNATNILNKHTLWYSFAELPPIFLSRCQFNGRTFKCEDYFTVELSETNACAIIMSETIRKRFGAWKTDTQGFSFGLGIYPFQLL